LNVRLQKFLAEAGVASRRAGERIILEGRVTVNDLVVNQLGAKVSPLHDRVAVDGQPVRAKKKIYVVLNKTRGCVCSRNDEHGRPTIYEWLPKEWAGVNSVGRLDYDTEGLLFLTNDGEFALRLTHPRFGVKKRYIVTADGAVTDAMVAEFKRGVFHEGERLKATGAWIMASTSRQSVMELELAEGKNREVRRMFETQNLTVKRLVRTQIGKIKLGELKPGRWRTLTETEIKTLLS
jgi:23S rRNA pseudouridine2605 synthase